MITPMNVVVRKRMEEFVTVVTCEDDYGDILRIFLKRDQNNDIEVSGSDREGFTGILTTFPSKVYDVVNNDIKRDIVTYLINTAGDILGMFASSVQEAFNLDGCKDKERIISYTVSYLNLFNKGE